PGEPDAGGASTPVAPLALSSPRWLPATEIHGEGIFVHFKESAIEDWRRRCGELEAEFLQAHRRWCQMRGLNPDIAYPTIRYVLLHSFAHALIRQLALECGYTTASIRERIYSQPNGAPGGPMSGVLLYTAAAD